MRQLNELFEKHDRVWFSLPDEESRAQFLKAVTVYAPDSTAELSQIGYHMAYGTDRQLRYVSWLVWTQTFDQMDKPVRVDYRKYRQGAEDFYITKPDSVFAGWK